jgi:hypothetical protein
MDPPQVKLGSNHETYHMEVSMEIMWKLMGIMWEIHGNNVGFIMGIIIMYLKFKWIVNGKIHMDVTDGTLMT